MDRSRFSGPKRRYDQRGPSAFLFFHGQSSRVSLCRTNGHTQGSLRLSFGREVYIAIQGLSGLGRHVSCSTSLILLENILG